MHATLDRANAPAGPRLALGRISLSQVWAAVAVLIPVLVVTSTPLVAIDLTYQLRAGDMMLDGGHLLRTDPFTVTAAGVAWTNQQWLAQVVLALAFRAGGWLGLALLRAGLAALVLSLVYGSSRVRGASRKTAALLTLGAGVLLPPGFQLRPQLFGMVCFALAVWLLARRDEHPRGMLAIPLVAIVWANVHGSFFLLPVLLAIAWVDERARGGGRTRTIATLIPATLIATLVNPYGLGVWTYVVGLSTDPLIRKVVEEWQPPTIRSYAGIVFFASAIGIAYLLSRAPRPVPIASYLTLAVFFVAGLMAIRGLYWWAVAAPVAIAPLVAPRRARSRPDPVNTLNTAVIGFLLVAVVVSLVPWLSHTDRGDPGARLLAFAPAQLTVELDRVLEPGDVVFNAQEWGSWLEFRFPDNPVTTDSRFEVIPDVEWRRNQTVSSAVEGWREILDGWGVDVAVLSVHQQSVLIEKMRADAGWELVYEDAEGAIAVRR